MSEDFVRVTPRLETPSIRIEEWEWRVSSGPPPEEVAARPEITFYRQGTYAIEHRGRSVPANRQNAVFFNSGSVYRVQRIAGGAEGAGTAILVDPEILRRVVAAYDPRCRDEPQRIFAPREAGVDSASYLLHRLLLEKDHASEALRRQEIGLVLVERVVASGYRDRPISRAVGPKKSSTSQDHVERIRRAQFFIASNSRRRLTLEEIARAGSMSPYHFSRTFRALVGTTVSRYQRSLRLRQGLEFLAGSTRDTTEIALDLGFSSRSHFSDAFRREFGISPSQARGASLRLLRRLLGSGLGDFPSVQ